MHPYLTDRVLTGIPGLAHVAAIARAHHEHLDGSGYPLERVLVSVVLASGSSVQMLEAPVRSRLAPHVRGRKVDVHVADVQTAKDQW